ncbi:MAG: hypothetical protein N2114_02570 [Candidatus Goldbacteria bacterium]|nr:hypothetical protein [Candidatus Goldiibacteriota bacterium]
MKILFLKSKIFDIRIFGWISFFSLLFQIVNGLWPQVSMLIFDGRLLFPNIVFKVIFTLSFIFIFLIKNKIIENKYLIVFYFSLISYLFLEFIYFVFVLNMDWKYILWGYNVNFFWFLFIPFLPSLSNIININYAKRIIFVIFIVSLIFGMLQLIFNSSILPIKDKDNLWEVLCVEFQGNIRIFSFFSYTFDFNFFVLFISYFIIFIIMEKENYSFFKKMFVFIFFNFIVIIIVYYSYLRNAYLLFLSSFFSFFVYCVFRRKNMEINCLKHIIFFSGIYFLMGLFLVIVLYVINYKNFNSILIQNYEKKVISIKECIREKREFRNMKLITFNYPSVKHLKNVNILNNQINQTENKKVKFQGYDTQANIKDYNSFLMRIIQWKHYISLLGYSWLDYFFGIGIWGPHRSTLNEYVTDNLYVNLFIHIGLLGFLIVLSFIVLIYYIIAKLNFSPYIIPLFILFPTFFLVSFFDEQFIPLYLSYFILSAFFLSEDDWKKL